MNPWFVAAAAATAATCLIHLIVGGKLVAAPLLNAEELRRIPRYTMYYCWHIATIVLAGMIAAFLLAATDPSERTIAIFATAAAASFFVWSWVMILTFRLRPLRFPQWLLFLPVSLFGLLGLIS